MGPVPQAMAVGKLVYSGITSAIIGWDNKQELIILIINHVGYKLVQGNSHLDITILRL